jgi:hypothetical protein
MTDPAPASDTELAAWRAAHPTSGPAAVPTAEDLAQWRADHAAPTDEPLQGQVDLTDGQTHEKPVADPEPAPPVPVKHRRKLPRDVFVGAPVAVYGIEHDGRHVIAQVTDVNHETGKVTVAGFRRNGQHFFHSHVPYVDHSQPRPSVDEVHAVEPFEDEDEGLRNKEGIVPASIHQDSRNLQQQAIAETPAVEEAEEV